LPLPLANATILRTYLSDDVERREISDGNIRGTLFLPKGSRRFPGVIDMFGSHGGLLEFRAAILASHGFAVLALAFYDYKDLPTSIKNLDLEYFMEAVQWLASHECVYQNGIGIIGVSYGGQVALQLAAECPMIVATVAISSPNVMLTPVKYQGKSIGLQWEPGPNEVTFVDERTVVLRDSYALDSDDFKQIEIQVEKIKGKVLLICGNEDLCISSSDMAARMQNRLEPHKRSSVKILDYPGTGHLIEVPFMPICTLSFHKLYDIYFMWGGNILEHSAAQEHSWKAIRDFLNEHIQDVRSKL